MNVFLVRFTLKLVALLVAAAAMQARSAPMMPVSSTGGIEVVASMDAPIPPGSNAIWCASFLAAWKALAKQEADGDIMLKNSPKLLTSLNAAADPRPEIPQEGLYATAGWNQHGVIERIQKELSRMFPGTKPPTFPGATPTSFIAYAYLEASVKFSLPYFQNRQPLEFTDSEGRKAKIASFGIRAEDEYAYFKLRAQSCVLFRKGSEHGTTNLEFAVDLCRDSKPSQIVVARIKREPTLAAAVARVDREIKEMGKLGRAQPEDVSQLQSVGPNDVLLVPDVLLHLSHHFSELEGKAFLNDKLRGQSLDVAQQDILFRLDRSGAELKSESKMFCLPVPTHFVLDRPFLIIMRKRGAKEPYLAMWIDNAQILNAFHQQTDAQPNAAPNAASPRR